MVSFLSVAGYGPMAGLDALFDHSGNLRSAAPSAEKSVMMNRPLRNLGSLLALALLVSGAGSVAAGEQASDVSGTVTVIATSVAAGIGWS